MFEIDSALRTLVEREGSDLHVKVGVAADRAPARGAGAARGLSAAEPGGHREGLPRHRRGALADRVRGGRRGRLLLLDPGPLPLPRQRLQAARLDLDRLPRDPLRNPLGRGARAAAGRHQTGRRAARDHPRHRHHRLGQEHDPGGDDRPHQPHPGATTSSPSRTRSSTCTKTNARSSTSAKSAPTPRASAARCAASCARTPT